MDFFDIIKELRKGEPDINKAGKAMKILGWICIAGSIWNCVIYYLAPFDESLFSLPPGYLYIAIVSLLFIGGLFLYSSHAIRKMDPVGKKVGQITIILLVTLFVGFMFFMFRVNTFLVNEDSFSIFFIIFFIIFLAQFGTPAYYGVRYLGRLPEKNEDLDKSAFKPETIVKETEDENNINNSMSQNRYKDALLPFGIFGTFALLIAVPLISFFAIKMLGYSGQMPFIFMSIFPFVFLTPVVYNFLPSSFQKEREPVASYTGGGSIFLFNGTWPFFRLIVYNDGLEIRVMFHRFFIPYDKMEDIPDKIGFFNRGILIKSNLPDVPSGIRYKGFGMKRTLGVVSENRSRFLTGK